MNSVMNFDDICPDWARSTEHRYMHKVANLDKKYHFLHKDARITLWTILQILYLQDVQYFLKQMLRTGKIMLRTMLQGKNVRRSPHFLGKNV